MADKSTTEVKSAWAAVWVILIGLGMAGGGAYLVYKYRLRVCKQLLPYLGFPRQSYKYKPMECQC